MIVRVSHGRWILVVAFAVATTHAVRAATQLVGTGEGYTLSINDTGRVGILDLEQAEYDDWAVGNTDGTKMRAMSNRVFNHMQDLFDFVIFVSDEDSVQGGYFGIHYSVQNDTGGLGKGIFDSSANYGSDGELESAIHLTSMSGILGGPSLHEIAHRWANSLDSVPTGGHWGFAGVGGQLGGWEPGTLTDLGNNTYDVDGPRGGTSFGTFANGGNGLDYGELELYLMGLIGPDEVTHDIIVPQNPSFVDSSQGIFTADSLETVSIDDIIATDGARTPNVVTSQKNFRAMVVVLTDDPLSDARVDSYDSDIERFSQNSADTSSLFNFWEATGGRATIQMDGLLQAITPLHGDYNNDGIIDAADYTVWRNNLGSSDPLPNDATPGTVDENDYTVWKTNFGTTSGARAALERAAVPEPGTHLLCAMFAIGIIVSRRR